MYVYKLMNCSPVINPYLYPFDESASAPMSDTSKQRSLANRVGVIRVLFWKKL